jgi:hypothetical protein
MVKKAAIVTIIFAIVIGILIYSMMPNRESAPPQIENTNKEIKIEPIKTPETDQKLQNETDALLNLFDKMPSVPVYLKDEPILKSGTNTEHGVAYTDCKNNRIPTIYIKRIFFANANNKQLTNILKHELTHAWLCRQGLMNGHDERFKKKFKEVGGFGN